jgi:NAD(P)-dependent dehydrogenase (short-subunit alcohol dehydrogenase family)
MELGSSSVRVNCICQGVIATPIFSKAMCLSPEQAKQAPETIKAAFADF